MFDDDTPEAYEPAPRDCYQCGERVRETTPDDQGHELCAECARELAD